MKRKPLTKIRPPGGASCIWNLWLYVAGSTAQSIAAVRNLERICEEHLPGRYEINIVDLVKNPQIAAEKQIMAVPALFRTQPSPVRRILGDLSNTKRVLASLDLPPEKPFPFTSKPVSIDVRQRRTKLKRRRVQS